MQCESNNALCVWGSTIIKPVARLGYKQEHAEVKFWVGHMQLPAMLQGSE